MDLEEQVPPVLRVYNSLNKSVEPLYGNQIRELSWYLCGPTVYDHAHLGHARNYINWDVIRRILNGYFGITVKTAMNITDIDDKIINRSQEYSISIKELTEKYTSEFFEDMDNLGVLRPDYIPKVTEYIPHIIGFIGELISNNLAYELDGSVYFNSKAEGAPRGKLVPNHKTCSSDEGTDFALWKSRSNDLDEYTWESPWGRGRPGWHIECSVMATELFGKYLDIHSGGIDLKFPHHNNEIIQTEAFTGEKWVNHFWHSGHLHIEGRKMAKSEKNFITIREAMKKYTSRQIRLAFLMVHYRSTLDYSDEYMKYVKNVDKKLAQFLWEIRNIPIEETSITVTDLIHKQLANDFSTHEVIKHIINVINSYFSNEVISSHLINQIRKFLKIIGLNYLDNQTEMTTEFALDILVDFRQQVRDLAKKKDFKGIFQICDELRDQILLDNKIKLEDTPKGPKWRHI